MSDLSLEKEFSKYAQKYLQEQEKKKISQPILESMDTEKKINTVASELYAILQIKLSEVKSEKELDKFIKRYLDLDEELTSDFKTLFSFDKTALNKKIVMSCLKTSEIMMTDDREYFDKFLKDIVVRRTEEGVEI